METTKKKPTGLIALGLALAAMLTFGMAAPAFANSTGTTIYNYKYDPSYINETTDTLSSKAKDADIEGTLFYDDKDVIENIKADINKVAKPKKLKASVSKKKDTITISWKKLSKKAQKHISGYLIEVTFTENPKVSRKINLSMKGTKGWATCRSYTESPFQIKGFKFTKDKTVTVKASKNKATIKIKGLSNNIKLLKKNKKCAHRYYISVRPIGIIYVPSMINHKSYAVYDAGYIASKKAVNDKGAYEILGEGSYTWLKM